MSRNKKKHSNTASPQNTKASRSIVNTVNPKSNDLLLYILPIAIFFITFFTFSPSLTCGFTNWDDPTYITKQDLLLHPGKENLKDIFTTNVSNNYHPLTMLSLKWNTNTTNLGAKPFHFTNVLLHLLNTLLVFIFIFLMSDKRVWIAAVVTLFFGIHPMHVESVTWIAERKDVLYSFFFLASLIAYFKFISSEKQKTIWYIFSFLLFTLSCLSKGVAVCLPIVLLLIDYYHKRSNIKIPR